jgi:hypothetical protein
VLDQMIVNPANSDQTVIRDTARQATRLPTATEMLSALFGTAPIPYPPAGR